MVLGCQGGARQRESWPDRYLHQPGIIVESESPVWLYGTSLKYKSVIQLPAQLSSGSIPECSSDQDTAIFLPIPPFSLWPKTNHAWDEIHVTQGLHMGDEIHANTNLTALTPFTLIQRNAQPSWNRGPYRPVAWPVADGKPPLMMTEVFLLPSHDPHLWLWSKKIIRLARK